jgi:hypothetical protein
MKRSPTLPEPLKTQLAAIEASKSGGLNYYPCCVVLRTGVTTDRVYVVGENPYISCWGVYPEQDPGKFWVRVEDVVSIIESPSRLPASFATKLYEAGESGMGYQIFTVVLSDGTEQAYVAGTAVDFIEYPDGKGPKNVTAGLPHVGTPYLDNFRFADHPKRKAGSVLI